MVSIRPIGLARLTVTGLDCIVNTRGKIGTAANIHDSTAFEELVDAIKPIKRPGRGRSRKLLSL